jgi:ABC-type transporter Mla maintaining outer membrane lipid asymmetry permease subunit MlaE
VLGFLLAAISAREGLVATGGALGVGRATNRAVIRSLVVVCGASLGISALIYGGLAR